MALAVSPRPSLDFASARGYDPSEERDLERSNQDDSAYVRKCITSDDRFDWGEDERPHHRLSETVVYEVHVRGFTAHSSSGVAHPGSYRGLTEKIPYLKTLGVTAVELLPVQEFNETSVTHRKGLAWTGRPVRDYWGYNPLALLAPKASYSSDGGLGGQVREFKEMVREFHGAGMEVILDLVLNHSGEGDELGPTLSFRGVDNASYYILQEDGRYYKDYTGTGNTLNVNNGAVREQIVAALRYWSEEMHVDGFRFDLAAVLCRGPSGDILLDPPLVSEISRDAILRGTQTDRRTLGRGRSVRDGEVLGARMVVLERQVQGRGQEILERR